MSYKVLITTSGTGSRLGELTKHTNKALVRVGKKPVISYIVESYPVEAEFVVTLGYKGEQVKDFLELAYPERKFTFIEIDKYEGPGTSLGYSMLQAKHALEGPFIFHACDTIIEGFEAPAPDYNWAAGASVDDFKQYTSFRLGNDQKILGFKSKGLGGLEDLGHIGLVGIHDYERFWSILEDLYKRDANNSSLNDVAVLSQMIEGGISITGIKVNTWLDIGNLDALAVAREKISDKFDNLDKVDESLFFFNGFAIKFFSDSEKVRNRVCRGEILGDLVPRTLEVRTNFYKYEYVKGERYSDIVTSEDLEYLISWAQDKLWIPSNEVTSVQFKKICRDFYEQKTKERIQKFLGKSGLKDEQTKINGIDIPTLGELLSEIDFDWLSDGLQTGFHGDFILENILKTNDGYVLLDWRQDFGGLLRGGDIYYDLAKFYHNLVVNHDVISENKFSIDIDSGSVIKLYIKWKSHLEEVEKTFHQIIQKRGFDIRKIEIIRALIWINMAPLHHCPFDIFLFYFGKYNLWQTLRNQRVLL
jgi:NDP-sugar pyrophosphorylase family protein